MNCPICNRELVEGLSMDRHHLIPRTFKGKEFIYLHRICHDAIHTTFTERELAQYYNTVERLIADERIQRFVAWVSKKAPDFYERTKDRNERKRKRRR